MIGKPPEDVVEALLDTLPVEFTLIDENDRIVAWNRDKERISKRSADILGTDIRDCHSEKSMDMLNRMLREMKRGERDKARFWYDEDIEGKGGKQKLLVEYYALRDPDGGYLGCVSVIQNIEELRALEGEKRTLD